MEAVPVPVWADLDPAQPQLVSSFNHYPNIFYSELGKNVFIKYLTISLSGHFDLNPSMIFFHGGCGGLRIWKICLCNIWTFCYNIPVWPMVLQAAVWLDFWIAKWQSSEKILYKLKNSEAARARCWCEDRIGLERFISSFLWKQRIDLYSSTSNLSRPYREWLWILLIFVIPD